MAYYQHNLDPVAFSLFSFSIRWYAIVYALGFILIPRYIKFVINKKNLGISSEFIDDLSTISMLGIIMGARLSYVVFYDYTYYLSTWDLMEVFRIYHGGLSFHGGVLGGAISIYWLCKKYKINFWLIVDLICIILPIFLFFGRIANFINGELYGRPTKVAWGVIFDDEIVRHPSQIYESLTEGLLLTIILNILGWRFEKLKTTGFISISFIGLYSIIRFFNEFFRESELYFYCLSMGQILSIFMLVASCYAFKKINK